jgi:pimeloyl-ACP methyl ester carboxylesterase
MPKIHSKITGSGTPVVLLHGFCEDLTLWDELQKTLASQYLVIAIDLPGFGQSELLPGNFSIADVAIAVHDYLLDQHIADYAIFGHSLGGYVAMSMMAQFESSILCYGLLHSTALADNPEKKLSRNKAIKFVNNYGVKAFLKEFVKGLFDTAYVNRYHEAISKVEQMGANLLPETVTGYMSAMRDRKDMLEVLQNTSSICLFLFGMDDSLFTKNDIERQVALLTESQVIALEKVAHMGMYEDFENFKIGIVAFLSQQNLAI